MHSCLTIISVVVCAAIAQVPAAATTTTTMSSSSSAAAFEVTETPVESTNETPSEKHENCSACISSFRMIYQNPNYTSLSSPSNSMIDCSQIPRATTDDTCFSFVRDNCTEIVGLLYTSNSNLSFGLTCSNIGIRVIKWTDCPPWSTVARVFNASNGYFCGFSNFSCSTDRNGILRIHKFEVLEPMRRAKTCAQPTTARPTIPLLPNPVGPGAITAIVVIICLFIIGVLAGFFFWPKCHLSEPPAKTPKKKAPPVDTFKVAYSVPTATGAPSVSMAATPGQMARGPAAA